MQLGQTKLQLVIQKKLLLQIDQAVLLGMRVIGLCNHLGVVAWNLKPFMLICWMNLVSLNLFLGHL
jgi:hypothetical protein